MKQSITSIILKAHAYPKPAYFNAVFHRNFGPGATVKTYWGITPSSVARIRRAQDRLFEKGQI